MRLYRLLLMLYPASFRAHYGAELVAVFARRRGEVHGPLAVVHFWIEAVADVLSNASRIHLDILRQDTRDALRAARRAPGFASTVVVVSALGIGATTATFSLADFVLVRPLPYAEASRLVNVWQDQSARGYSRMELSPLNFRDWKAGQTAFEYMAAYVTGIPANLVGEGTPVRLDGTWVTEDFFPMLGVPAARGRSLAAADFREASQRVVVLSDRAWRLYFQAAPDVVGRTIMLSDEPAVVAGVMPARFGFPTADQDFWTPFRFNADGGDDDRANLYLRATARLKPGATIAEARAQLAAVAQALERQFPEANAGTGATVVWLRDEIADRPRLLLYALVGAALAVLLIACTNLANLLLARGLARRQELAVRAAIGAGRERLVRQALTESLLLAGAGGVLGVGLALAAAPLISRLVPNVLPIGEVPGVDLRLLAVASLMTLATGVGFAIGPALGMNRLADTSALRDGARAGTSRRTERLRTGLVVAEVAITVVLLISAGLLMRALWRVQQVDPGFRADGVLTLRTDLPMPEYGETDTRLRFYERVTRDIEAIPGVTSAAYISFLPMVMRGGIWPVAPGAEPPVPGHAPTASLRYVTPGFFRTMAIPIVRGRDVADTDTTDTAFVAVVSQSFARQHWPDSDPIGQTFYMAFSPRRVVGLVADIKVRGLERDSEPQVYLPASQQPGSSLIGYTPRDLVVRASLPPGTLLPAIREVVTRADPRQPISDVLPLADIVDGETASRQSQLWVLGAFAAVAFGLAAIGIHGLLAFAVSARVRDIGVRLALGAHPGGILRMVLGRGATLAAAGILAGAATAFVVGRFIQALLAGVDPGDTLTFVSAMGLAGVMTLAGSLLPALRAARVDPVVAMRAE
ncbi:MAG: ABC transporter permease [Vicinamibacterales bacterium]